MQDALTEATKRAAVAERKAAEYLLAKEDAERQLQEQIVAKAALSTSNERLTAENERLKEELQKLEKDTKNCEKATTKAQKEAKNAKGNADHLINSQKGQLKSAERRYAEAARDLAEWRDRYGWAVGKPAEENAALQARLSEWQSKAEKARNEIAALKGGLQEQQSSVRNGKDPSRAVAEKHQSGNEVKGEPSSAEVEEDSNTAAAEAKAAKYKEGRDALLRVLQEEMARNAKLAESLVLRNAKVVESLKGWAADGGEC